MLAAAGFLRSERRCSVATLTAYLVFPRRCVFLHRFTQPVFPGRPIGHKAVTVVAPVLFVQSQASTLIIFKLLAFVAQVR